MSVKVLKLSSLDNDDLQNIIAVSRDLNLKL